MFVVRFDTTVGGRRGQLIQPFNVCPRPSSFLIISGSHGCAASQCLACVTANPFVYRNVHLGFYNGTVKLEVSCSFKIGSVFVVRFDTTVGARREQLIQFFNVWPRPLSFLIISGSHGCAALQCLARVTANPFVYRNVNFGFYNGTVKIEVFCSFKIASVSVVRCDTTSTLVLRSRSKTCHVV